MHCQKINTYMETGRVVFLPFSAISPNPNQPRILYNGRVVVLHQKEIWM